MIMYCLGTQDNAISVMEMGIKLRSEYHLGGWTNMAIYPIVGQEDLVNEGLRKKFCFLENRKGNLELYFSYNPINDSMTAYGVIQETGLKEDPYEEPSEEWDFQLSGEESEFVIKQITAISWLGQQKSPEEVFRDYLNSAHNGSHVVDAAGEHYIH